MGFSKKIKYYLVHTWSYTNRQAQTFIDEGLVSINGQLADCNSLYDAQSEIALGGKILQEKQEFVYLLFHKPPAYESSLNTRVDNNLSAFFTGHKGLAIAGRLDKDSEGMLLLSNDGQWVERICHPKFEKTKEYRVWLDRAPDPEFVKLFRDGVRIGEYTTQPCGCEIVEEREIKVILKEGKNRQIRKMCKTLGYKVQRLKRTRIADFLLADLAPGEYLELPAANF